MKIALDITGKVRCDIVAYGAIDHAGKRTELRVFPGGNTRGSIESQDLRSIVVKAFYGTRVILCSHSGPDWMDHPWRCITILKGNSIRPKKPTGLPMVIVPDIDRLDRADAQRTNQDVQTSYPHADSVASGEGWSFGRFGATPLKARVKMIRFERDEVDDLPVAEAERVAHAVLARALEIAPDAVDDLVTEAVGALTAADSKGGVARGEALRAWVDAQREG
jgi:hypothetical protein